MIFLLYSIGIKVLVSTGSICDTLNLKTNQLCIFGIQIFVSIGSVFCDILNLKKTSVFNINWKRQWMHIIYQF